MNSKELNEFEKMLKSHDWYYMYSEQHSIWRKGNSNSRAIQLKLDQLRKTEFADQAEKLHKQYNPYIE